MKKKLRNILVVADMDNTLLTAERGIPQENIDAIREFTQAGGLFTVASGRTAESVGRYLQQLNVNAPVITCNGAVIYDFAKDKKLNNVTLPKAAAKNILDKIIKLFPDVGIEIMGSDGLIYVVQSSEYTYRHTVYEKLRYVVTTMESIPCAWNKVLFSGEEKAMCALQEYCETLQSKRMYFVATNTIYFEIMPAGVTKGNALKTICETLHINLTDTVAIGDYYNDVELLQTAGFSVAMGNAPQDIQDTADYVTGDCLSGGVAQVLRLIMDGKLKKK